MFASLLPGIAVAADGFDARWYGLGGSCDGRCSVMVFGGKFVDTSMTNIFLKGAVSPLDWAFGDSTLIGFAASKTVASLWDEKLLIQPELGMARRFGSMDETEVWSAVFFRYVDFPWNDTVYTTFAVSTGLNYASGISRIERKRSGNDTGDRLLHYLAPEVTFALPQDRSRELVVRFHHRSGAMGIVSETDGGAQYLTVGLRVHF